MALSFYVVDDHDLFRSVARMLLESEGYEVTGEASSGETALNGIRHVHPDVVLLDVQLPGIDGFEVARLLSQDEHPPAVLLTSTRPAEEYGTLVTASRARFIQKQALSGQTLHEALGPTG